MPGQRKHGFLSRILGNENAPSLLNGNYEAVSRKRSDFFQNAYMGETAYIVSCGPSLEKIWNTELRDFLSDKLVISIKQAHDKAPEITDFHLYNEVRVKHYEYPVDTVRVSCSKFLPDHPSHIHYPIREYQWDKSLFVTNEYDKWSMENSYERPWGIGIMFEMGLFFPIHLGCKRVLIMGFDMNSSGRYHFYDNSEAQDSGYYKVNREEFHYASSSIPHYLSWAKSRGVEVKLHSPLSALPIPQVKDIYTWAEAK